MNADFYAHWSIQNLNSDGFPAGSVVENLPAIAGEAADVGSTPGLGRFLGGGNDNPLQNSFLEKSHGQRSLESYSPWGFKSWT